MKCNYKRPKFTGTGTIAEIRDWWYGEFGVLPHDNPRRHLVGSKSEMSDKMTFDVQMANRKGKAVRLTYLEWVDIPSTGTIPEIEMKLRQHDVMIRGN
jgi:hypothetical protein